MIHRALNSATINAGLQEIEQLEEQKQQQTLLNASFAREMRIRDRINNPNLPPPRSLYANRFRNIMDITGTRSRRRRHNQQL